MLCRFCGRWTASETAGVGGMLNKNKTTTLDQIQAASVERIVTGGPWDAAFGGGIVPTSIVLTGGAPGGGKTTMLLQISSCVAEITGRRSYFLSAEQAPGELRIVAERLGIPNMDRFRVMSDFGAGAEIAEDLFKEDPPAMIVLDSISSLVGKDVHAAIIIAKRYKAYASKYKAPAFLVSHMTKEFDFGGLLALQHEVDTLVTLFPEEDGRRMLKAWKNRYGPTHGEYVLMMTEKGLGAMPEKKSKKSAGTSSQVVLLPVEPTPAPPPPLTMDGQRLIKIKKSKTAMAIEGEALKRAREPMPKKKVKKVS